MGKPVNISLAEARNLILNAQLLNSARDIDALEVITSLGYVQIDTISVVERAHHHTIFVRNTSYDKGTLDDMLAKDRTIFEYWSHAASYLPMKDFRYSLLRKHEFSKGDIHWYERDKKTMRRVLKRIKEEGPMQSKDFEGSRGNKQNVWNWKPAKRALEQLFMEGKLMTSRREGFQKVYDLTERVLPDHVDTTRPTRKEFCRYLITSTLNAQGLASEKEIKYLRRGLHPTIGNVLNEMKAGNEIIAVQLPNIDERYFMLPEKTEIINIVSNDSDLRLLSPFDNLIIQRERVKRFFNFDYLIECYVPENKRVFGYFCMPILYGDILAGRMDAKADRKTEQFLIKNIWLESHFGITEEFIEKLVHEIDQYSKFCGCRQIQILNTIPDALKSEINSAIKKLG